MWVASVKNPLFVIRLSLCALLLGLSNLIPAQEPNIPQGIDAVGSNLLGNVRALFGPEVPAIPSDLDKLSCGQLYAQRIALMRYMDDYAPAYWDDPRNGSAVALGTLYTPVFYYLGYTAVAGYQRTRQSVVMDAQLSALRQASARQDCFVR